ncbi:MAG: ABC transporter permease subunit [Gemmobacter sp.]
MAAPVNPTNTAFVYDPLFLEHETGPGFPESADRLRWLSAHLESVPLGKKLTRVAPDPGLDPLPWIAKIHDPDYIAALRAACEDGAELMANSSDSPISRRSYDAAVRAVGAALVCAAPVLLGFVLPAAELLRLAIIAGDPLFGARFAGFALNSLGMAAGTAAALVGAAVLIVQARRLLPGRVSAAVAGFASFGYAVPGAVIALGVLIPLAAFDRALDGAMQALFGISTGLLLTGSIAALLLAYMVRFLAIALRSVEAAFARIPPSLEEAARALGASRREVLWRVHLPMVRGGLLSAAIFVFADVMKELPATLIVRPFDFDTLAVRVFRLASDGRLEQASTAALAIVVVGILPVILLSRALNR